MIWRALLLFLGFAVPASGGPFSGPLPPVSAQVVILGEVHDNPGHHLFQAETLAALAPGAVVFEMLDPAQAARVTPDLLGDAEALAEALDWAASGWPDFALYAPVFAALGAARIHGAALPRDTVRAAVADGAAARFGAGAARFGLDQPLPEGQQSDREAMQMAAHCDALPAEILPGMVEAQRLRDAHLAQVALAALEETGGPVVVITGNGHARRDWGVPALLALAAPDVTVVSVGQLEHTPEGEPPFDLWRVTAPTARPDPCAAFR